MTSLSPPSADRADEVARRSRYVPVDQRWLGLDRRALPFAIVAVVLMIIILAVIPAINDATSWSDETAAGDVIDLGEGITIKPPVGWLLEAGFRTTEEPVTPVSANRASALVANGGVTVQISLASWDQTADALLDQADELRRDSGSGSNNLFTVTGARSSTTTASGLSGVQEAYTSAVGNGITHAFVIDRSDADDIGILIIAEGSEQSLGQAGETVDAMVSTLAYQEPTS